MESKKTNLFGGGFRTAQTHTNLLKNGSLKKQNTDYDDFGMNDADRNIKVNKAGIAQLLKTNTKLNLDNYSVTTQGI